MELREPNDRLRSLLAQASWSVPVDALARLVTLRREEVPLTLRGLLSRTDHSTSAVSLQHWTPRTPRAHPPLHGPCPTILDLAEQQGLIQEYGKRLAIVGSVGRTALAAYLAEAAVLLLAAPAPRVLHKAMLTSCAQLTHLLARMSEEASLNGLARRHYQTALGLAHEADDRSTYAIILRAMSVQALRIGDHSYATELAHSSRRSSGPDAPPAVRSFVLAQRALTHAAVHRRGPALTDLANAECAHDKTSDAEGPFSSYPRAALDYQRAQTLRALNDLRPAQAAFRDAIRRRPSDQHKAYALTHASLAESLLATGDLEEACAHWSVFLDHYLRLHSARADRALWRLQHSLAAFPRQPHAEATLHRAQEMTCRTPRICAD
jgi:tetratricopeptide (TPR) repeat protein